jgi:hypothetical protein
MLPGCVLPEAQSNEIRDACDACDACDAFLYCIHHAQKRDFGPKDIPFFPKVFPIRKPVTSVTGVTAPRQMMKLERAGLATAAELDPALALLEDGDCIRPIERAAQPQGGRPPRLFTVNPALLA